MSATEAENFFWLLQFLYLRLNHFKHEGVFPSVITLKLIRASFVMTFFIIEVDLQ